MTIHIYNDAQYADTLPIAQRVDNLPDGTRVVFGRVPDIDRLDEMLDAPTDGVPIVQMVGMAGVGKSELALRYAKYKRSECRGGVALLNAANFLEDLQDFVMTPAYQIAGTTDLRLHSAQKETKARVAWELWAKFARDANSTALVVIDDVTDWAGQIADFLPDLSDGELPFRFVLTSRKRWDDVPCLDLEELDLRSAADMFCHAVGEACQDRVAEKRAIVESLCDRLGRLPLALLLTGSWLGIADANHSLEGLIAALDERGLASDAFEQDGFSTQKLAWQSLAAAFQVSWDLLPELDGSAQQLARVLSLFVLADLPWRVVERVAASYPVELPPEPEPRRGWLENLFGKRAEPEPEPTTPKQPISEETLERARRILYRMSLLREIEANRVYRLHPLLHEFFELQWQDDSDRQGWELALVEGLSEIATGVPKQPGWEEAAVLQPVRPHLRHAQQLARELRQSVALPAILELRERLKRQDRTLEVGELRLHQEPIFARTFQAAQDAYLRAKALLKQGKQAEAQAQFEAVLAGFQRAVGQGRKVLPGDSLLLAGYLERGGSVCHEMGRYLEAIPMREEALAIVQKKASKQTIAIYANNLESV